MDKIGILRCGVIQMLSIKVPWKIKAYVGYSKKKKWKFKD